MAWDPAQYLRFAGPRLRPALDLLARIDAENPALVYDLGAGHRAARLVGVDDSAEMLDKAATEIPGIATEPRPDIRWQKADLAAWRPERPADIVYSNAALHWLGAHDRLFLGLFAALAPNGVLAVQMPRNFAAPSHTLMTETAASGPWRHRLVPLLRPAPVAAPDFYYDLLAPRAAALDIWETEYLQVLEGENPVKEWTKGTWLGPLLAALDEPERSRFEAAYAERIAAAYPRRADGRTLFPFRRLFIIARAPG